MLSEAAEFASGRGKFSHIVSFFSFRHTARDQKSRMATTRAL